jgi:hypothetical protein
MNIANRVIEYRRVTGRSVVLNGIKVTPQWSTTALNLPFPRFVWRRPLAVIVEQEGRVVRKPIVDLTRIVKFGLLLIALLTRLSAISMAVSIIEQEVGHASNNR